MATNMEQHPFGAGSHAPLADVHEMPACYPIKGNTNSMKYHRPDSQGYNDTKAEVWFDSPSAAEAAGFQLAGGHSETGRTEDYEPGGAHHPCTVEAVNAARAAVGSGATTITSAGSATVDGAAGITTTEISGVDVDGGGISGKAAAAGAAGVAGAAGLAAAAGGKLSGAKDAVGDMAGKVTGGVDVPDVNAPNVDLNAPNVDVPDVNVSTPNVDVSAPNVDVPDVDVPDVNVEGGGISGKAAAAGAAGIAGAAGLAGAAKGKLGDVGGSVGDVTGKVTGKLPDVETPEVKGRFTGVGEPAKASIEEPERVRRGAAAATTGAAASTSTVRTETAYVDNDDDDGGLMGCLAKWWWLAALLLGVLLLALLLSQCGGDDGDADADAAATTEAPTTTEAEVETTTEAPTTTEAEVEETTTTTEAPETTTTTEAEPEVQNLAGVYASEAGIAAGFLGPLGLNEVLEGDGPVTLFLPSDEGGTQYLTDNPDAAEIFTTDPTAAAQILGYHVVPGEFLAADLEGGATLVTATGLELVIADGAAGGVEIVSTDLVGSNGVIHLINGVLTPPAEPQLAVTGSSTELVGAIGGSFLLLGAAMVVAARRRDDEELAA